MSSFNYSFWVEEGEGMAGAYKPGESRKDAFLVGVITIAVGERPDIGYSDGIRIFLKRGTDIASVAKAFRDIAEGIERTMLSLLIAEDWEGIPWGANHV